MDLLNRIDPEVAAVLPGLPVLDLTDIPAARQALLDRRALANAGLEPSPTVVRQDHFAGTDRVSPYAAPARAVDLSGLPPAYLAVGDLDLFVDEDIEYAQRLQQADVPTELHVYPGGIHAFDAYAPASALALRFAGDRDAALRRAFAA